MDTRKIGSFCFFFFNGLLIYNLDKEIARQLGGSFASYAVSVILGPLFLTVAAVQALKYRPPSDHTPKDLSTESEIIYRRFPGTDNKVLARTIHPDGSKD